MKLFAIISNSYCSHYTKLTKIYLHSTEIMSKSLKSNFRHLKSFIIDFSHSKYFFNWNKFETVAIICNQSQIYNHIEFIQNRLKLLPIISNSYCSHYTTFTKIHLHFTEVISKSLKSKFNHLKLFIITFSHSNYFFNWNKF